MDNLVYTSMTTADWDEVYALWHNTEGVGLDDNSDSLEGLASYLERNPGLSFITRVGDRLVGAVLCGHDGRRGYLHHLAVAEDYRGQGIGRRLVEMCLEGLKALGIPKCNIIVYGANETGRTFWANSGWIEREDLILMQKCT